MPNGLSNGKSTALPDELFFAKLTDADPAVCDLVEKGYRLKSYLGIGASGDTLFAVRSFLAAVRRHLLPPRMATVVVVSTLDVLDLQLPEEQTPEALELFYAALPWYQSLTAAERAALAAATRTNGWVEQQLRIETAPHRINAALLTRRAAPRPHELVELYQNFLDCRTQLLATAICYSRRPDGWENPYREITVVDYLKLTMFRDNTDDGGEATEAPEGLVEP